uniref:Uncharacterized protein n=1 Tax=Parascaris equorum TaxID=6256 RepID=A0A914RKE7_PAREQ
MTVINKDDEICMDYQRNITLALQLSFDGEKREHSAEPADKDEETVKSLKLWSFLLLTQASNVQAFIAQILPGAVNAGGTSMRPSTDISMSHNHKEQFKLMNASTLSSRCRFYEMDQWYKARIDKPEIIPELHIIDPDKYLQPLEERLKGFKERKEKVLKKQIPREDLEKLSRTLQLRIDLKRVDHSVVPGIFHHFRLFDDLFGDNVFFRIVQRMIPSCGKYDVYFGNVLHAGDTIEQPKVVIESDGRDISSGTEVVPYLQALPFKGTGYHRFAFILFRHEKQIGFDAYRLKGSFKGEGFSAFISLMLFFSNDLSDRIFSMQRFYKENEASLTPSSAPLYEYEYRSPLKVPQKEFPNKAQPFDL